VLLLNFYCFFPPDCEQKVVRNVLRLLQTTKRYCSRTYFKPISQFDAGERGAVADGDVPRRQTVSVHRETATALADEQVADVGRVRADDVAAGPREARRQTKDLVVLRAQDVLALPAVHAPADACRLLVDVEQNVLTTSVGGVDELEAQLSRRTNADVRYVPVPVTDNTQHQ